MENTKYFKKIKQWYGMPYLTLPNRKRHQGFMLHHFSPVLGHEPLRPEVLRIAPDFGIVVDCIQVRDNDRVFWEQVAAKHVILEHSVWNSICGDG